MDVSLDMWLGEYMEAVQVQFGPRVWFIGLQGSFGRGEVLVLAGAPSRRGGVVLSGELEAYHPGPEGARVPITRV